MHDGTVAGIAQVARRRTTGLLRRLPDEAGFVHHDDPRVVDGERAKERVVTVGQTVAGEVEVTTGLMAGERIVTSAVNPLTDGARVVAR